MPEEFDLAQIKRENAALTKYAALQKGFEDKVSVQKIYIDLTGNLEAAFVLDEIIFFTLPREGGKSGLRVWKDGHLWIAVQRDGWWQRKRLKPRQADRAIQKLIRKGLVIKDVFHFNGLATTHLRLNIAEFFRVYSELLAQANPPELQDDTLSRDINDLYAMMGLEGVLPNHQTVNRESPKRHSESPFGDSFNNLHSSSTNNQQGAEHPPSEKKEKRTPKTKGSREEKTYDDMKWPDDCADLLAVYERLHRHPLGTEIGLWIKTARQLKALGVTPVIFERMIADAKKEWPDKIKSPGSFITGAQHYIDEFSRAAKSWTAKTVKPSLAGTTSVPSQYQKRGQIK